MLLKLVLGLLSFGGILCHLLPHHLSLALSFNPRLGPLPLLLLMLNDTVLINIGLINLLLVHLNLGLRRLELLGNLLVFAEGLIVGIIVLLNLVVLWLLLMLRLLRSLMMIEWLLLVLGLILLLLIMHRRRLLLLDILLLWWLLLNILRRLLILWLLPYGWCIFSIFLLRWNHRYVHDLTLFTSSSGAWSALTTISMLLESSSWAHSSSTSGSNRHTLSWRLHGSKRRRLLLGLHLLLWWLLWFLLLMGQLLELCTIRKQVFLLFRIRLLINLSWTLILQVLVRPASIKVSRLSHILPRVFNLWFNICSDTLDSRV